MSEVKIKVQCDDRDAFGGAVELLGIPDVDRRRIADALRGLSLAVEDGRADEVLALRNRGSQVQAAFVELRRACKAENVDYGSVLRAERESIVLDPTRPR